MRTLKLAGIAAVGLAALTACNTWQGAAVFVGDERISESTVDGYVDDLVELQTADTEMDLAGYDYTLDREFVIEFVVLAELGRALDLEPPEQAGDDLQGIYFEGSAYRDALLQQAEPRELTEEEIEALTHAIEQNPQLAQAVQQDPEQFAAFAGLADDLDAYVDEYDITASPRYGDVAITLIPGVWEIGIPQR